MRLVRLFVLVIVVLVPSGAVALAKDRAVVRQGLRYKPHEITLSGDGDLWVQKLRWRSWGRRTAVAHGQAVEQVRPSHTNHTYPARVTLSRRTYCANLHRTVYNKIVAHIVGPSPGVFGGRTFGLLYTCAGTWQLLPRISASDAAATRCATRGMPHYVKAINSRGSTCARARTLVRQWFHRLKQPGGDACIWADGGTHPGLCTVRGWRCTSWHTVNGHTYPVTCTARSGRRRVHFVNQV